MDQDHGSTPEPAGSAQEKPDVPAEGAVADDQPYGQREYGNQRYRQREKMKRGQPD